MKTFVSWFIAHAIVFALLAFGLHTWFSSNPTRVLIAVDSSHAMATQWTKAMDRVDEITSDRRYRQFAVITDKKRVHAWQQRARLENALTYGPRQLNDMLNDNRYPELAEADQHILISNVDKVPSEFSDWRVVKP